MSLHSSSISGEPAKCSDLAARQPASVEATAFRAAHDTPATWSAEDFEVYLDLERAGGSAGGDAVSGQVRAPFEIGDRVCGTSYMPPERLGREKPEEFEGTVVQLGSSYAGVDADRAFLWARLDDGTERQALIRETELLRPADAAAVER